MPTISGKPALSPLKTEFKKETTSASASSATAPAEQSASFSQHPSPTKVLQKGRSGSRDWLNVNTPESAGPGSDSKAPSRKSSFVDLSKFSFGSRKNTGASSTLLDSPSALGDDSPQSAPSFLRRKSSAIWGRKASTYSHLESSQELGQSPLSLSRMSSSALSGDWMTKGEIDVGRKYCHSYQQWQDEAIGGWQKQRQQAEATLKDELGKFAFLGDDLLKEMETTGPVAVLNHLKGDYRERVIRKLTPETRAHVRKLDFIRDVVKPIIDAAETQEKEGQVDEEGAQQGEDASYVVENGMRVGSFNSHFRTALLEKEMDDFIEQHKSAHGGVFPDRESISKNINSLLEETRNAATNGNWMASLSSDLKKAAQSHLEKNKSQIPDGIDPHLAREHLDAQVEEMLNHMLDTENPHQEATWEKFDKRLQDEMPVLVANAVTLPILFDRLDGFRQRQSEVEQRKAALDDSAKNRSKSKEPAPRYLSLVEDVASSILGKLQKADKTQDAAGVIYTKDVDQKIRKRELIKNFGQAIQDEWRFEGVDEDKARALEVRANNAATTYTGMMDVGLKEKLLEAGKYAYAQKLEKTHDADGSAPTRDSIEAGITKLDHKATEEATDDWIQQIADELTIQCEKLAKGYNKARDGYSTSFGGSSASVTTYNLSVAVKILREEIPAAVRKIIQKMET
jgi:hypothetical protein